MKHKLDTRTPKKMKNEMSGYITTTFNKNQKCCGKIVKTHWKFQNENTTNNIDNHPGC